MQNLNLDPSFPVVGESWGPGDPGFGLALMKLLVLPPRLASHSKHRGGVMELKALSAYLKPLEIGNLGKILLQQFSKTTVFFY